MPVIDVTKDNFQETIDNNDKVVAKFFASWCGSCRLIKPKFKRLADDERFEGVTFIDIDAEANPDIRAKVGVNNLPFFAVWQNGELVEGRSTAKEERVVEMIESIQG